MHGELRHSLLPVERDGVGIGLRPADSHEPHPGLFRGGRVDRSNSCHGVIPAEADLRFLHHTNRGSRFRGNDPVGS